MAGTPGETRDDFDERLARCMAAAPARRLSSFPRVMPTITEARLVRAALILAARAGLWLPPRFVVLFTETTEPEQFGETKKLDDGGQIVVTVNLALRPALLLRVIVHELKHVSDLALGLDASELEHERRALDFEAAILGPRRRQPRTPLGA